MAYSHKLKSVSDKNGIYLLTIDIDTNTHLGDIFQELDELLVQHGDLKIMFVGVEYGDDLRFSDIVRTLTLPSNMKDELVTRPSRLNIVAYKDGTEGSYREELRTRLATTGKETGPSRMLEV